MTTQEPHHIAWEGSGTARLISLDGDVVVLHSSRPFAPGSRPEGRMSSGSMYRMKTHRSRRQETSSEHIFEITGRLLDMTRAQRAEISAFCQAPVEDARAAEAPFAQTATAPTSDQGPPGSSSSAAD